MYDCAVNKALNDAGIDLTKNKTLFEEIQKKIAKYTATEYNSECCSTFHYIWCCYKCYCNDISTQMQPLLSSFTFDKGNFSFNMYCPKHHPNNLYPVELKCVNYKED